MTQRNTSDVKPESFISIASMENSETETQNHQYTSPKTSCSYHGPSKTPLLDSELQKPQVQPLIHALSTALNELADQEKCTQCALENISTLLTSHIRDLRTAKQNGEWSKEDRKALKAEAKILLKPLKKQFKSLWRAN